VLSFAQITPDQFWEMTPAETRAILDRRRNEDEMRWNHTSALMWAMIAPHTKKGADIKPDKFHPYRAIATAITADKIKAHLARPDVQVNEAKMKAKWKERGKKSVFEKMREAEQKNKA
jgi:Phage tail assembly chaperone protein, TAC